MKVGASGDGYRLKATFRYRPDVPVERMSERMQRLYNIRPFRRITREDMEDVAIERLSWEVRPPFADAVVLPMPLVLAIVRPLLASRSFRAQNVGNSSVAEYARISSFFNFSAGQQRHPHPPDVAPSGLLLSIIPAKEGRGLFTRRRCACAP